MKFKVVMFVEGETLSGVMKKIRDVFPDVGFVDVVASEMTDNVLATMPDPSNKILWIKRCREITGMGLADCVKDYNKRFTNLRNPRTNPRVGDRVQITIREKYPFPDVAVITKIVKVSSGRVYFRVKENPRFDRKFKSKGVTLKAWREMCSTNCFVIGRVEK